MALTLVESEESITLADGDNNFTCPIADFLLLEPSYPQGLHAQRIYRNAPLAEDIPNGSHVIIPKGDINPPVGAVFPWTVGEAFIKKIPEYREKYGKITMAKEDAKKSKDREEALAALTPVQRRSVEYPSIGDQLDAIWKGENSTEFKAMKAKIAEVKKAFPKE